MFLFLHMWLLIKKTINFKLILLFQVQKCYEDNIYTAMNGYISNTKIPVTLIRRNNLKRMNSNKKNTWCDSFTIHLQFISIQELEQIRNLCWSEYTESIQKSSPFSCHLRSEKTVRIMFKLDIGMMRIESFQFTLYWIKYKGKVARIWHQKAMLFNLS